MLLLEPSHAFPFILSCPAFLPQPDSGERVPADHGYEHERQRRNNVMIGGFIVGPSPLKVLVRAIGPSLSVPGKMADPTLELHDGNGVLMASNDNWRTDQEAEIMATTIPPTNDAESAIVATLPVGGHTAIVRGKNSTTGVALVEVYSLQ